MFPAPTALSHSAANLAANPKPWPLDQFGAQIRPCPRARPGGQPVGLKILKHKPDRMFFVILELKCQKKTLYRMNWGIFLEKNTFHLFQDD